MIQLVSKIQYNNFEIGEFIKEKYRTYDEVIKLIEDFPWEKQRENIVIDLTNPSITVEGKNNDYLKLALYYNGKFALHYFDQKQKLYTKSFYKIEESFQYIKSYFESPILDTGVFKNQNTLFKNSLEHFISQDFNYVVTSKSARQFLGWTSGMNLMFTLFFLVFIAFSGSKPELISILVLTIAIFLIGGGMHLILFFQFYLYSKNKQLIMSKGNEVFYFGNKTNLIKYNKAEILRYRTQRFTYYKHPLREFIVVTIELKNGRDICIPNILINYSSLNNKLFGIEEIIINGYPTLNV